MMQKSDASQIVQIATLQTSLSGTPEHREHWVSRQIEQIAESGERPNFVLLPELWYCGFFAPEQYKELSESMDGRTVAMARKAAQKLHCYVVSGSFIEKRENRYYNTTVLINPDGHVCGQYSKIHLFGYQSAEREILSAGSSITVVSTEFGKIGFSTCYDLRFPELYRAMVEQGAQAFFVVSAWPEKRLEHWRLFNQVRALENQCFLVSCNCAGCQNGVHLAAHSMTVTPNGEILMEAENREGVYWSTIDFAQVQTARDSFPALHDRSVIFQNK